VAGKVLSTLVNREILGLDLGTDITPPFVVFCTKLQNGWVFPSTSFRIHWYAMSIIRRYVIQNPTPLSALPRTMRSLDVRD